MILKANFRLSRCLVSQSHAPQSLHSRSLILTSQSRALTSTKGLRPMVQSLVGLPSPLLALHITSINKFHQFCLGNTSGTWPSQPPCNNLYELWFGPQEKFLPRFACVSSSSPHIATVGILKDKLRGTTQTAQLVMTFAWQLESNSQNMMEAGQRRECHPKVSLWISTCTLWRTHAYTQRE